MYIIRLKVRVVADCTCIHISRWGTVGGKKGLIRPERGSPAPLTRPAPCALRPAPPLSSSSNLSHLKRFQRMKGRVPTAAGGNMATEVRPVICVLLFPPLLTFASTSVHSRNGTSRWTNRVQPPWTTRARGLHTVHSRPTLPSCPTLQSCPIAIIMQASSAQRPF